MSYCCLSSHPNKSSIFLLLVPLQIHWPRHGSARELCLSLRVCHGAAWPLLPVCLLSSSGTSRLSKNIRGIFSSWHWKRCKRKSRHAESSRLGLGLHTVTFTRSSSAKVGHTAKPRDEMEGVHSPHEDEAAQGN